LPDDRAGAFATCVLIAGASFAAGGLVGLLFGIPRAVAQGSANTNLEQASDWLTKVLLGAGLTQLGQIGPRLADLGGYLGPAVGGGTGAQQFAVLLVVAYVLGGFFLAYVEARQRLPLAFRQGGGRAESVEPRGPLAGAAPTDPPPTPDLLPSPEAGVGGGPGDDEVGAECAEPPDVDEVLPSREVVLDDGVEGEVDDAADDLAGPECAEPPDVDEPLPEREPVEDDESDEGAESAEPAADQPAADQEEPTDG
jgi:hypothetical protein